MITLRTPAKVNIGLWVERLRRDGYHDLRSIFLPVDLYDTLTLEPVEHGLEFTCDAPFVPCDSNNLVYKAADLYFTYSGVRSGVRIKLGKKIPVGHGLGGGSSDASATLTGLNKLFNTELSADDLRALSLELGMDCPFFLDPKPSIVTGRGEEMESVKIPPVNLVLYSPEFSVSTPWAYKHLRRLTNGRKPCRLLIKTLHERRYRDAARWLYNSFEHVVYKRYPLLERVVKWLLDEGAWFAGLSGSGSALFAAIPEDMRLSLPEGMGGRLLYVRTLE